MKTYHIRFQMEDDWYVIQAEEDESVFSQARTLDEAVLMIRDVLYERRGEREVELRLIIPDTLIVDDLRQSGRITHPVPPQDSSASPPTQHAAS